MRKHALACLLLLVGCDRATATVDVRLRPVGAPGLLDRVDTLLFSVADAEGRTLLLRRAAVSASPLRLDGVPFEARLTFAFAGLRAEAPVIAGRTCTVDVLSDQTLPAVSMLVGRVDAFAAVPTPPTTATGQAVGFVRADGALVMASGADAGGAPSRAAASFNPRTGVWADEAPLAVARRGAVAVELPGGDALIIGGLGADGRAVARPELYRQSQGFVAIAPDPRLARIYAAAATLPDARVLVAGGAFDEGPATDEATLWSPTATVSAGPMTVPRRRHSLSIVGGTSLWAAFVIGGEAGPAGPALDTIELFNPHAAGGRPFALETAHLARARAAHTATVLADGEILIAGGEDGSTFVAEAELFDPTTRTVLPAGSLMEPRRAHAATRLPDGRVLVAGGIGSAGTPLASAEIWNPATREFSVASSLIVPRAGAVARALCDHTVLVAGGGAGAEVYVGGP